MRDYNFFEVFLEERRASNLKKLYYGMFITLIIGIIVSTYTWNYFKIQKIEKDITAKEQILKQRSLDKAEAEKNKKMRELEILQQYYDAIYTINNVIMGNDTINTELIKTITEQVPGKIYFTTMNVNYNSINIQGISENRTAVAELEDNLKKCGKFENVYVSGISLATEEIKIGNGLEDTDNNVNIEEGNNDTNSENQENPIGAEEQVKIETREVGYSFSITCTLKEDKNAAKDN